MEVLHTKHPNSCPLSAASLETYTFIPPEIVPVDIIYNKVAEVVGSLYGGAGPGGTDSVRLQH